MGDSFFLNSTVPHCRVGSSVAYPECLSWIQIFFHPGSINNKKGLGGKSGWLTFFLAINFLKLKIILFLNRLRKKIWTNWRRMELFLPKKLSQSSQKWGVGIWDLRSGIQKNSSRIRIQGSKKHRILDPRHWWVNSVCWKGTVRTYLLYLAVLAYCKLFTSK